MRTARFLLLACGASLLSFAPVRVRAQQNPPPPSAPPGAPASQAGASAKNQTDVDYPENDDSLGLSQDQKDRIKAVRDDSALQLKDAQKDTTLTEDQRDRKIRAIKKQTRAKVFGVLTPEQQKAWALNRREQRESKAKDPKTP